VVQADSSVGEGSVELLSVMVVPDFVQLIAHRNDG
jgi:hypothetical protein